MRLTATSFASKIFFAQHPQLKQLSARSFALQFNQPDTFLPRFAAKDVPMRQIKPALTQLVETNPQGLIDIITHNDETMAKGIDLLARQVDGRVAFRRLMGRVSSHMDLLAYKIEDKQSPRYKDLRRYELLTWLYSLGPDCDPITIGEGETMGISIPNSGMQAHHATIKANADGIPEVTAHGSVVTGSINGQRLASNTSVALESSKVYQYANHPPEDEATVTKHVPAFLKAAEVDPTVSKVRLSLGHQSLGIDINTAYFYDDFFKPVG